MHFQSFASRQVPVSRGQITRLRETHGYKVDDVSKVGFSTDDLQALAELTAQFEPEAHWSLCVLTKTFPTTDGEYSEHILCIVDAQEGVDPLRIYLVAMMSTASGYQVLTDILRLMGEAS